MMYNHYVAIAIVDETRFQAVCNPIKCGWVGSVTGSQKDSEFEREIHYIETQYRDTQQNPQ